MNKKYIFISGGVISGIGKGISAASIALILKQAGYKVTQIKFENYLNIDAGTINPIEHGDPFLCDDGTEADMDIGTYEKYLNKNMGKHNFVTMGQIYKEVIDRERRFEYMGEDVEAIPHIIDEVFKRIDLALKKDDADIIVIELGGTAGEYQNIFYYEANRILALRKPGDVIHIHVSYMPTPNHLGEPKTKPTQLSVKMLNGMGIQPDILIARADRMIDERRRERFSMFCNLLPEAVFTSPDVKNVYEIPLILEEQGISKVIQNKLGLQNKKPNLEEWKKFLQRALKENKKQIKIAIVGKYFSTGDYQLRDSYAALFDAINHASWNQGIETLPIWIDAEKVEKEGIEKYITSDIAGIIVPIGWGKRGAEGMIKAASFARKNKIPYLGLCYGMQLAVIAFARDVLGYKDANTEENDKKSSHQVIHLIPNQKELLEKRAYGGTMRLGSWDAYMNKESRAFEIYKKYNAFKDFKNNLTSERHRHRYEFNNDYLDEFRNKGLVFSAFSKVENLVEIIELPKKDHPFYFGTQGHPEYKSRPLSPHPLFIEFIKSAVENIK